MILTKYPTKSSMTKEKFIMVEKTLRLLLICDFGLQKDKKGHTPPISKRKVF